MFMPPRPADLVREFNAAFGPGAVVRTGTILYAGTVSVSALSGPTRLRQWCRRGGVSRSRSE
jgi:hypothetical protein